MDFLFPKVLLSVLQIKKRNAVRVLLSVLQIKKRNAVRVGCSQQLRDRKNKKKKKDWTKIILLEYSLFILFPLLSVTVVTRQEQLECIQESPETTLCCNNDATACE
jgi:nitrate reductase NapE component